MTRPLRLLAPLALAIAGSCLACRQHAPAPAKLDPLAPAASIGAIALPSSSLGPAPADGARVYATTSALYVDGARIGDGPRPEEGYPAKDRLTSLSLEITELSRRLSGKSDVLLYADRGLDGVALLQLVYSAKAAGAKRVLLMTNGQAGVRAVPIDLSDPARRCPPRPPAAEGSGIVRTPEGCDPGLALGLVVTTDGVVVVGQGRRLGVACTQPGPGLSVTGFDAARLRACIATAHVGVPASESDSAVTVAPAEGVTVADLVRVIDELRGGDDARFSTFRLGKP